MSTAQPVEKLQSPADLLPAIRALHRRVREHVLAACRASDAEQLREVASDAEGDTIYAIDRIAEELLVEALTPLAERGPGIVLVAEGLPGGRLVLPQGSHEAAAGFVVIVDPIDGTRGLMYQKRSAWVLTGVARYRGSDTSLSDIEVCVQTELPLIKQYLADELVAVRGGGVEAWRVNVLDGSVQRFRPQPSRASSIEHGYAMLTRFFPGGRDELAAIDDELVESVLGPTKPGKAACFEDQYASTGGQLYELAVGHDRFNADLRPLVAARLERRGQAKGLCCHPYDLCTLLIAQELGVIVTTPEGLPLDAPLDVDADVAWVGYANQALRATLEPALQRALQRRGWL